MISLLKRLGLRRESRADDAPTMRPMRSDLASSDLTSPIEDVSGAAEFTPASWPTGEKKQHLLLWTGSCCG